jgi:DNA-directed RNA polymerase subunit H
MFGDMGMSKKFSIFDHVLVPQHILLSKKEAEEVLKQLGVKPHQLPYIRVSDPAARALGAKRGDIIKIIRKSPTAGTTIIYRYVVPG